MSETGTVVDHGVQAGTSCFVDSISCCGLNGLPMKPCAPRDVGRLQRVLVDLAAEHDHRDRADAVALVDAAQHLPAVDLGHHHVEQDQVGRLVLEGGEALLGARGLAHRVALHLEVHADELAKAFVVVDDQDQRAGLHRAWARPSRRARGTGRGRCAGSGGGRRACRRRAAGPCPTTCGSCSAPCRGTSRPGRASASPAHLPARAFAPLVSRSSAMTGNLAKSAVSSCMDFQTHGVVVTVTVTVSALRVPGSSVRTDVCVPDGAELSSSAWPSAIPIASTIASAAARSTQGPTRRRRLRGRAAHGA